MRREFGALPLAALIISVHEHGRFNLQAMMHRAANKPASRRVMGVTRLRIWGLEFESLQARQ